MLVLGATIAGGIGLLAVGIGHGQDVARRRKAACITLALELESRRVAFEAKGRPVCYATTPTGSTFVWDSFAYAPLAPKHLMEPSTQIPVL